MRSEWSPWSRDRRISLEEALDESEPMTEGPFVRSEDNRIDPQVRTIGGLDCTLSENHASQVEKTNFSVVLGYRIWLDFQHRYQRDEIEEE